MARDDDIYYSPRQSDRRIKPAKEPPKIATGTLVEVCPDDMDLRCRGWVVMCLPGARVEVRFRSGATLVVARSLVRKV